MKFFKQATRKNYRGRGTIWITLPWGSMDVAWSARPTAEANTLAETAVIL